MKFNTPYRLPSFLLLLELAVEEYSEFTGYAFPATTRIKEQSLQ